MDVKLANLVVIKQVDEVQFATVRSLTLMLEMTAFISSYDGNLIHTTATQLSFVTLKLKMNNHLKSLHYFDDDDHNNNNNNNNSKTLSEVRSL